MIKEPVLVTGATGYVGGRLVDRLLSAGYKVRAASRSIEKLRDRTWSDHPNIELVEADLFNFNSIKAAVSGCHTAYYLIHSMNPESREFTEADRKAARAFVRASDTEGLKRIIYLGGLGEDSPDLSPHLKSRAEVGRILQSGQAPVTILRSALILGSGSASFEMLRYLSERLPMMLVPERIVETEAQPICIRNVLNYLVGCLENELTIDDVFDIGGPDIVSYRRLFEIYTEEAGLRRPVFFTRLPTSNLGRRTGFAMAKLVLPLPSSLVEPLLEGLATQVVVRDNRIKDIISQDLMTCRDAIKRAIQKESLQIVETSWTDAGVLKPPEWVYPGDAPYAGGTLLQGGFKAVISAPQEIVWPLISRIGGRTGWYYGDLLWRLRGWMDILAGGVGLRRGRRHPEYLQVGDALDFWRVLKVEPPNHLILVAEMKLPGEAILEFGLSSCPEQRTELRMHTRFKPQGLYGLMYWYVLLPFHDILFGGMLREIARKVGRPIDYGPKKFRPEPFSQRSFPTGS